MENNNVGNSNNDEAYSHKRSSESIWYLNNYYSKHMARDLKQFITLKANSGGKVILGDKTTKKVIGTCIIGKNNIFVIKNIFLVIGLKYNMLSISQLWDKGFDIKFFSNKCLISLNGKAILEGEIMNNTYMLDLNNIGASDKIFVRKLL